MVTITLSTTAMNMDSDNTKCDSTTAITWLARELKAAVIGESAFPELFLECCYIVIPRAAIDLESWRLY